MEGKPDSPPCVLDTGEPSLRSPCRYDGCVNSIGMSRPQEWRPRWPHSLEKAGGVNAYPNGKAVARHGYCKGFMSVSTNSAKLATGRRRMAGNPR